MVRVKRGNVARIVRINASVREDGLNYSSFMSNLKHSNVALNRKMLAQLAVLDAPCLKKVINLVSK